MQPSLYAATVWCSCCRQRLYLNQASPDDFPLCKPCHRHAVSAPAVARMECQIQELAGQVSRLSGVVQAAVLALDAGRDARDLLRGELAEQGRWSGGAA